MTLFSYLLTFMGFAYWGFRVVVVLQYQLKADFFAQPVNVNIEIILLFLTLFCLVFVAKRNIIAAAAYFGMSLAYFGSSIYDQIINFGTNANAIIASSNLFVTAVGVIIPLLTFLDVWLNKNRKGYQGGDKKTDWYYRNEKYDRDIDERADRNQYRI